MYTFDHGDKQFQFEESAQFKHCLRVLETHLINVKQANAVLASYVDKHHKPNTVFDFDIIMENQRGLQCFGIPLFSNKTLIPQLDPAKFQSLTGNNIMLNYDNLSNYPLPDLDWKWCWDSWYVFMVDDVDDQGWMYLFMFFREGKRWKGKYFLGNFVRRRIWIRMREKLGESEDSEQMEARLEQAGE